VSQGLSHNLFRRPERERHAGASEADERDHVTRRLQHAEWLGRVLDIRAMPAARDGDSFEIEEAAQIIEYEPLDFCTIEWRPNLSVAAPDIMREFSARGVDRAGLGVIVSAGVLAYAIGKVITGMWGDFLGGRITFIAGMIASAAATVVFGLSSALAVCLSDHVGSSVCLVIANPLLALAVVALSLIGSRAALDSQITGLILLSGVAFLLIGPYSLLAGAIAMELGGRRGSATDAGLIDSAGYLGAVLSGWGIGSVAERSGWTTAFQLLAIVAAGAVLATLAYCALQQRAARLATARGQA